MAEAHRQADMLREEMSKMQKRETAMVQERVSLLQDHRNVRETLQAQIETLERSCKKYLNELDELRAAAKEPNDEEAIEQGRKRTTILEGVLQKERERATQNHKDVDQLRKENGRLKMELDDSNLCGAIID